MFFNNLAIGEKPGSLEFNINAISGHSSFKNLIPNTTWIKKRSQLAKIQSEKYTTEKVLTKMRSKRLFTTGSSLFNLSPDKKNSLAEVINCTITKRGKLISLLY